MRKQDSARQERRRQRHPEETGARGSRGPGLLRGSRSSRVRGSEHLTRGGGSTSGPLVRVLPVLPPASAKDGERGEEKSRAPGAAAGELGNKSSPSPGGTAGSWGRKGREARPGGVGRAGGGRALPPRSPEVRPEPGTLPSRCPGADARSPGARLLQTFPGPRAEAGKGKGLRRCPRGGEGAGGGDLSVTPRAEGRVGSPGLAPPTAPAAGNLPRQPAARPARPRPGPGGQVPRSPGPREPPGRERSAPPAPSPDVSVSRRRGKGAEGAQEPVLPAALAASRNRSRRSPRAPQRSAAVGGSGRPRLPASSQGRDPAVASPPRFSPPRTPGGRPLSAGPRDPGKGGADGLTLFGAGPGWGDSPLAIAKGFGDLKSPAGLQVLDDYLADKSHMEWCVPSKADVGVFEAVCRPPFANLCHALCWYSHITSYDKGKASLSGVKKALGK
ncbi:hypothetical protein ABFV05_003519 [Capra hircus]